MAYIKTKLAQVFPVYNNFTPSKASVHLKTSLHSNNSFFSVEDLDIVIDATNFSSLIQGGYKFIFNDSIAGYTGKGCMEISALSSGTFPILSYPAMVSDSGIYNIYFRVRNPLVGIDIDTIIDGEVESSSAFPAVGAAWSWIGVTATLVSGSIHTIGFQIQNAGAMVDKIVIKKLAVAPAGDGPDYTESPYLTIHMRLFSVDSNTIPDVQYFIYDYKTTISEVVQDGWYNFNINFLHSNGEQPYTDLCALVLSSTGSNNTNFMFWDLTDSTEYVVEPSLYFEI